MHCPPLQSPIRSFFIVLFFAAAAVAQSGPQFQQVSTFPAGQNPTSVTLADFNGDGKLDVVAANQGSNNISVLLGNGDGTFKSAQNTAVGQSPDSLAVGDFNRDGKADLAVANFGTNTIDVLLGNGDGTFENPVSYNVGTGPTFVVTADFDNDGRLDLAVVASSQLSILLGNGDGSFQNPIHSSFTGSVLAVGDFNDDGKLDLASSSVGSIYVALGKGNGDFKPQSQVARFNGATVGQLLAVDVNRDSKTDLVAGTSKGIMVLEGRGNGKFDTLTFFGPKNITGGLAAGDLNGDGKPDLVVGASDLAVFRGHGDGTFSASQDYMESGSGFFPAIGDLNHDNKLDVVTGKANGSSISVHLNKGNGTFHGPRNFNLSGNQTAGKLLAVDVNEDGYRDLVLNGNVMLGNGDGTFRPPMAVASLADPEVVGDFNNDGIPDLITFGKSDSAMVVLLGNGDGSFQFVGNFDTGGPPAYATLGDFDGDGNLDAAVLNNNNPGNVAILFGNGDGTFQSPVTYPTSQPFTWFVISGDFNNDGKLDLIVGSSQNTMNLLLGKGNGSFKAPKVINAAGCFAADPDLNGDNKLDIVLVGCADAGVNDTVTVLLGNGNGTFKTPANYPAGVSGLFKVHDVNNDGGLDLIIPDSQNKGSTVAVLPGNGNGTFQKAQNYFIGGSITGATVGDFNVDNFWDLAVGNGVHASILLNTKHAAP